MTEENYDLNNTWSLWIHELNNKSWDNKSYNKIYECNNLFDYNILKDKIKTQNLQNCMYFLMRNDIYPMWEDPENREGCSASFKVPLKDIKNEWDNLILKIISEDIHININNYNFITGVSISPKKEFNIIKLWFNKDIKSLNNIIKTYNNYIIDSNCRFKKHF